MTLEQLLRSDPENETERHSPLLGSPASEPLPPSSELGEAWDERQIGAPVGQRSLGEQLRDYVNVEPGRPNAAGPPGRRPRPRTGPPAFAGIDLAAAADKWADDTVQALVQSTLKLEVDERGRAYFSILGFGDFSLTFSGDRSRLLLSEGDHALFLAELPEGETKASEGLDTADSDSALGYAPNARAAAYEQPGVKQALERIAEVASHPVSLLVYCIFAAYLVLWSVLTQQRNRPQLSPSMVESGMGRPVYGSVAASRSKKRRSASRHSSRSASSRSTSSSSDSSRQGTSIPGTSIPGTSIPSTSIPGTSIPSTSTPGTSTPHTSTPRTNATGTDTPSTSHPGTGHPGTGHPGAGHSIAIRSVTRRPGIPGISDPGASHADSAEVAPGMAKRRKRVRIRIRTRMRRRSASTRPI